MRKLVTSRCQHDFSEGLSAEKFPSQEMKGTRQALSTCRCRVEIMRYCTTKVLKLLVKSNSSVFTENISHPIHPLVGYFTT
jgi:hypothetical protein